MANDGFSKKDRSSRTATAVRRASARRSSTRPRKCFCSSGYLGTNMDEIAALSGVSKQTVYKHFSSKEALFIEIVTSMTDDAGDLVRHEIVRIRRGRRPVAEYLFELCPPPALHRADAAHDAAAPPGDRRGQPLSRSGEGSLRTRAGPRAMSALAANFESLAKRGLLDDRRPEDGRFPFQLAGHVGRR